MTAAPETGYWLNAWLAPLAPFLGRHDVTDIYVNRPGEIWVEALGGGIEQHDAPELNREMLLRLSRQIAAFSNQGISRAHPLLAASLPDGSRVQVAAPPATRGEIAIAIRRHVATELSLEDYFDQQALNGVETARTIQCGRFEEENSFGDPVEFLRAAVRQRQNILISGGTSTGKTTFLNTLLREVPSQERLILIEDTPELNLIHSNSVGLLAARSELAEAQVGPDDLLNAALRMRPDRIIVGELRGPEAYTFLRAVNTGHPGSMSTIHANTPAKAVEQLALLVLQSGARLGWDDVVRYVRSTIDVFVQLERSAGKRRIVAVELRSQQE